MSSSAGSLSIIAKLQAASEVEGEGSQHEQELLLWLVQGEEARTAFMLFSFLPRDERHPSYLWRSS